ncbi:MAG: META domain-containing protein [Chloroflexi bacterium]|nr:META domain-containing protein [Chloroflexota bacterium]
MDTIRRPRAHRDRAIYVVVLALAAAAVAACVDKGASPGPSATADPSAGPLDLDGTTWRATLIGDAPPLADAPPTIQFDGGQAGGTTACNMYGGAYQLTADGSFTIDSMIMTEMACDGPRGTQEGAVIEILQAADTLEVLVDGQIRISGPKGSITFAEDPR